MSWWRKRKPDMFPNHVDPPVWGDRELVVNRIGDPRYGIYRPRVGSEILPSTETGWDGPRLGDGT